MSFASNTSSIFALFFPQEAFNFTEILTSAFVVIASAPLIISSKKQD
jgi:hypothetical protein